MMDFIGPWQELLGALRPSDETKAGDKQLPEPLQILVVKSIIFNSLKIIYAGSHLWERELL
jgi:hypothetical protein